jgi:polysaccharide export outer membrane protein
MRARWTVISLLVGSLGVFLPACASAGGSIEVEQLKDEPDARASSDEYVINIGDVLSIQVWEQEKMSGRMRVRSDGRISLQLLNDVDAAGKTPVKLARDLEAGLKSIILNPMVTVVVEESKPPTLTISVLGEVAKSGVQLLEPGAGVAQALAAAGGLTPFAHKDRIFVLRTGPQTSTPTRIHFTYDALTRSVGKASQFQLRSGDVVVVE